VGISMELLSEDLIEGLDVFEDVIKNAVFPEEEIIKQKEKIVAFIGEQDTDIFGNGMINLRKLLYGSHPYAMRVQGEKKTVNAITREEISNFYKKYFVPEGSILTVVGDVNVEKITSYVKRKFKGWEGKKGLFPERDVPLLKKSQVKNIFMEKEQALFLLGFRGVQRTDKRKYVLDVASAFLSGTDGLLFKSLRKQRGLSYVSGAVSVPEVDPGYFVLYAATTENNLEKAKKGINAIIKTVKAGDISKEEIESCRERLISQWAYAIETNEAVSKIMALDELYGLGFENYKEYPAQIKAVEKNDLVKCARNFFESNSSATVVVHSE